MREYQIDVDPEGLARLGLSLDMLMMAVQKAGRDVGAMSVEQSGVETMIRGVGFIRSVEDVENIVLRGNAMQGAGLRLGEIAEVQLGGQFRQGLLADAHGEHVGAIIGMRVGEDPHTVIQAVKRRLADLAPALTAEQLVAVPFYDRSQLILETNATLAHTLIEELIVTVLVIVVFLLHARASFAVAISLPLAMLFSFLVMHLFGVSANIMSLAGIAIAIGVMVDFGIIMTENITQHLVDLQEKCRVEGRAMPTSPFNAEIVDTTIAAAKEVARPLATSAATTVIGFLPIFALQDQAGRLFEPLALTKSLAISGAVIFGTLLVPVLCRLLLPPWQVRKPVLIGARRHRRRARLRLVHPRWLDAADRPRPLVAHRARPGSSPRCFALLAASAVWRIGRERLVNYEENPVSHAIHVAYDWAYTRILRHKVAFTVAIATLALGGYLLGARLEDAELAAAPGLRPWPAAISPTRVDAALTRCASPASAPVSCRRSTRAACSSCPRCPRTGGLGETQRIMRRRTALIDSVPEVAALMGKMGRAETALDPGAHRHDRDGGAAETLRRMAGARDHQHRWEEWNTARAHSPRCATCSPPYPTSRASPRAGCSRSRPAWSCSRPASAA